MHLSKTPVPRQPGTPFTSPVMRRHHRPVSQPVHQSQRPCISCTSSHTLTSLTLQSSTWRILPSNLHAYKQDLHPTHVPRRCADTTDQSASLYISLNTLAVPAPVLTPHPPKLHLEYLTQQPACMQARLVPRSRPQAMRRHHRPVSQPVHQRQRPCSRPCTLTPYALHSFPGRLIADSACFQTAWHPTHVPGDAQTPPTRQPACTSASTSLGSCSCPCTVHHALQRPTWVCSQTAWHPTHIPRYVQTPPTSRPACTSASTTRATNWWTSTPASPARSSTQTRAPPWPTTSQPPRSRPPAS